MAQNGGRRQAAATLPDPSMVWEGTMEFGGAGPKAYVFTGGPGKGSGFMLKLFVNADHPMYAENPGVDYDFEVTVTAKPKPASS